MVRYLLVDDRDGRVLEELSCPQQAARVLARHAQSLDEDPHVSVVLVDHQHGGPADTASAVSVRYSRRS